MRRKRKPVYWDSWGSPFSISQARLNLNGGRRHIRVRSSLEETIDEAGF